MRHRFRWGSWYRWDQGGAGRGGRGAGDLELEGFGIEDAVDHGDELALGECSGRGAQYSGVRELLLGGNDAVGGRAVGR